MNNSIVSKKLVGAFLAVGILAVLIAIVGGVMNRQPQPAEQKDADLVEATTIRKNVDNDKLPDRFPADWPQEAGATILQNDVQTSADGKFQSTRSYVTAKTLADNYSTFQTYLQKSGWKITTSLNQADAKSLSATKGDLSVQINLNDNKLTKQKTVDIYLIQIRTN